MDRQTFEFVNFPFAHSATKRDKDTPIGILNIGDTQTYTRLLELASQALVPVEPNIDSLVRNIEKYISDDIKILQTIPPLLNKSIKEFEIRYNNMSSRSKIDTTEIGIAILAATIAETAIAFHTIPDFSKYKIGFALSLQISSYVSWQALKESELLNKDKISSTLKNIEEDGKTAINKTANHLENMRKHFLEIQQHDINLKKETEDQKSHWNNRIEQIDKRAVHIEGALKSLEENSSESAKRIGLTDKNLAAFKEAVIEEVRGKETRKLWTERGNDSRLAFLISVFILAIFLLVIPIICLLNLDQLLAALRHIGDAATEGIPADATSTQLTVATLSRLVVITFPLVLYLWIIRLVVRFSMRSLVLHDDARQRQTMMDTYFMLIAQQAASKEERGLILNALFRPSPGHGSDNIEPPSFTELVGKGTSNT